MAFPSTLPEREAYILQQVQVGNYEAAWAWVKSELNGHKALIRVMSDALIVEGVRVNVSATLEQQIADHMGCMLLTPKVADLIWLQRQVALDPFPRDITASTEAMIEHSGKIDDGLAKLGNPEGLLSTVGKHWTLDQALTAHPGKAQNYGWHVPSINWKGIPTVACASLTKDPKTGSYFQVIQPAAFAHDPKHVDYSQTCVLMKRYCWVDSRLELIADVIQDAELAPLFTHNGVTTISRQPGVPEVVQGVPDDYADPPLEELPVC